MFDGVRKKGNHTMQSTSIFQQIIEAKNEKPIEMNRASFLRESSKSIIHAKPEKTIEVFCEYLREHEPSIVQILDAYNNKEITAAHALFDMRVILTKEYIKQKNSPQDLPQEEYKEKKPTNNKKQTSQETNNSSSEAKCNCVIIDKNNNIVASRTNIETINQAMFWAGNKVFNLPLVLECKVVINTANGSMIEYNNHEVLSFRKIEHNVVHRQTKSKPGFVSRAKNTRVKFSTGLFNIHGQRRVSAPLRICLQQHNVAITNKHKPINKDIY
jgi:hypothetical protein